MRRIIGRLSVGVLTSAAISAFAAAPTMATTVTTGPATNVTETTAILQGAINTGTVATAWQFQWGTTTTYGRSTPPQQIAAGNGTVPVSSTLTGLKPNTKYHFRLAATTGTGTSYYPLNVTFGHDLTLTTKATGRVLLVRSRLVVTSNFLSVLLRCASGLKCHGRFTISARARIQNTHAFATVLCATKFYTVRAHRVGTTRVKVRHACLELLRGSPDHTVTAKLTSNPRTGQKALIAKVKLVLG